MSVLWTRSDTFIQKKRHIPSGRTWEMPEERMLAGKMLLGKRSASIGLNHMILEEVVGPLQQHSSHHRLGHQISGVEKRRIPLYWAHVLVLVAYLTAHKQYSNSIALPTIKINAGPFFKNLAKCC